MTRSISTKAYGRFRQLLIETRKEAGYTQEQLAEKLNRPQSFVSKFEQGERRLDVVEFLEVLNALDADPSEFIEKLDVFDFREKMAVRENSQ